MATEASKPAREEPRNMVVSPVAKPLQVRAVQFVRGQHASLDDFLAIFQEHLEIIRDNYCRRNGGKKEEFQMEAFFEDVSKGLQRLMVEQEGFDPDSFQRYDKWAKQALTYKVTMLVASRVKSIAKLEQIKSLALKYHDKHTHATMTLAYDIYQEKNRIVKSQALEAEYAAAAKVNDARVVTPIEEEETRHVEFTAKKNGKGKKTRLKLVDGLDSPFGLPTVQQIPDIEECLYHFLDTCRRFFDTQSQVTEYLASGVTTDNAVAVRSIHAILDA
jgi:hypothetical protein